MFERLIKWLKGRFVCIRCKKIFFIMNFGYGKAICPKCYKNDRRFLWLDQTFILNRMMLLGVDNER